MDPTNQSEEVFSVELDRLETILTQKDAEIRRLKSESELRDLYINELHTALEAQAAELAMLGDRVSRLEPVRAVVEPSRGLSLLRLPRKNVPQ